MTEDAVRQAMGKGEVYEMEPPLGRNCPVTPLGHKDGVFYFLDADGQIASRSDRQFSQNGVLGLFMGEMEFLIQRYPIERNRNTGKTPWDNPSAVAELMRTCRAAGYFNPSTDVRGVGVWLDEVSADDGAAGLIVHLGDRIMQIAYREGRSVPTIMDAPQRIGQFVYPHAAPEPGPELDGKSPGPESGQDLLAFLETCSFRYPETDPRLMLGGIACAMVVGAAPFRPPVWIAGGSGVGKSTLVSVIRAIMGSGILYFDDATMTGVRNQIGAAARPVILDEFEVRERNHRAQELVELSRFTYTRGQGRFVRGGSDGQAGSTDSMFFFSSVEPPAVLPQDANRRVVIELTRLTRDSGAALELEKKLRDIKKTGPALRRRMLDQWGRFGSTLMAYRTALLEAGHDSRGADTFGTLLTCGDMLISDAEVDSDTAREWGEKLSAHVISGRHDMQSAEEACWTHLMTQPPEKMAGGSRQVVGDHLSKAVWEREHDSLTVLKRIGIAVVNRDGEEWVAVANSHANLQALFSGTRWHDGGWLTLFRRFERARASKGPIKFAGVPIRATLLPVAMVPKPPIPPREQEKAKGEEMDE